jgi:hypothetical protein
MQQLSTSYQILKAITGYDNRGDWTHQGSNINASVIRMGHAGISSIIHLNQKSHFH